MKEEPAADPLNGDRWTILAHILRPQGRRGEVLADLLTDFPERFGNRPRVFLAPENFTGPGAEATNGGPQNQPRSFEVASFWLPVGRNQGRIVLHLSGIDSINDAQLLAGLDLIVPETERLALEDSATYISDLVGCTLYDRVDSDHSNDVGIVMDVQFATTADGGRRLDDAAPLLAVQTPEGEEVLIPFVKEFLISLDTAGKRIVMVLPAGLLDVNRS